MESNHKIYLHKDLQKLICQILKKKGENDIYIHPFNRFGNTGSALYLIYFSKIEDGSLPFILKTFTNANEKSMKNFEREMKGMKLIKNKYDVLTFESFKGEGELSGILLKHVNDNPIKINDSQTLANILYYDEIKSCEIINDTFHNFRRVYTDIDIVECNIKELYNSYLRKDDTGKDKTRSIIEKLVGNIEGETIYFDGEVITNPVYVLDNLKEKTKIVKSLIHGDLHLNNIVLDDNNYPRIIDFAWTCYNDIYIDFSILEIAARYWNAPLIDFETKNKLEGMFLCRDIKDSKDNQDAQKIITIVRNIRLLCEKYCKRENFDYDFNHHLLSQFLILYGLQSHTDKYNPYIVIPFLAKLGKKLIEIGYTNKREI